MQDRFSREMVQALDPAFRIRIVGQAPSELNASRAPCPSMSPTRCGPVGVACRPAAAACRACWPTPAGTWPARLVPLLVGLAVLPLLIRTLGLDRYGFLTLVWVLVGYASIFDFGIGRVLIRVVALRLARGDDGRRAPHRARGPDLPG